MNGSIEIQNEKEGEKISRRKFLLIVGWGAFFAVMGGAILSGIRFLFPNALNEPPRTFKLGKVDAFPEEAVSYVEEHKIFVVRDEKGLRCVSAICTHLGCTVNWDDQYGKFLCPCHGSAFARNGKVLNGAAPRPLEWFKVVLSGDKRILVDKGQIVDSNYIYEV